MQASNSHIKLDILDLKSMCEDCLPKLNEVTYLRVLWTLLLFLVTFIIAFGNITHISDNYENAQFERSIEISKWNPLYPVNSTIFIIWAFSI